MRLLDKPKYRAAWEKAGFKAILDPYTNTFVLGLNMEPYRDPCAGQQCGCQKGHELDPTLEAVVTYQNSLWAYGCALADITINAAESMGSMIQQHDTLSTENHRLTILHSQLKECILAMVDIVNSELTHHEGCNATNPGAAMRGKTNCTCPLKESKNQIDQIVAKAETIR